MTKERSRSLLALAGFGLDTAGAAWCGARSSRKASRDSWYRDLDKPGFTPPDAVFPVVRTSLYPLIARSEWRIWSAAPSRERYAALRRWISQLVANPQWSKLCFGERRPTLALADVLAPAGMIGPTQLARAKSMAPPPTRSFRTERRVAFATVLHPEIARRNPQEG
jgi:translocator protein